jgi:hypothetical protein
MTSEYDDLIASFRDFDAYVPPSSHEWSPQPGTNGDPAGLPGADYNARGSWHDLLTRHGWIFLGHRWGLDVWSRPGKTPVGVSATTGLRSDCGRDLLYVFSSNAVPFEPNRSYSKFAAKAVLEFQGNFAACAAVLATAGYGTPAQPMGRIIFSTPGSNGAARPERRIRIEPYHRFPTEALPAVLRSLVEQGATSLVCDAAYFALPVLAAIASCIGNTRVISLKEDWTEPMVLWPVVVGESGSLKTPALHKVTEPLYRWEFNANRMFEPLHEDWEKEMEAWNYRNRQYRAAAAKAAAAQAAGKAATPPLPPPPRPVEPVQRRWLVSDTTIEKLAELLTDFPRGLLLIRDELGGWVGSFQRYHRGNDLPQWLEAYRAGPWIIDRKTGERRTLMIPRAAVSICGGFTPGAMKVVPGRRGPRDGLWARHGTPPHARTLGRRVRRPSRCFDHGAAFRGGLTSAGR